MDFIKEDENTSDYILQKDTPIKPTNLFVAFVLIVLIVGIIVSGFYFGWF